MFLYGKMTQKVLVTTGGGEDSLPAIVQGDDVQNPEAIAIQSKDANTALVFIGKTGVQTDDSTGAFVFAPGDNGILPYTKDESLKVKSNSAGQVLYITYLSSVG